MCPWALFISSVNGPLNSGAHRVPDLDGDGVRTQDADSFTLVQVCALWVIGADYVGASGLKHPWENFVGAKHP